MPAIRILLVNPNTTASMTGRMLAAATAVAAQGTELIAATAGYGPESIEGYYDEVFSIPPAARRGERPSGRRRHRRRMLRRHRGGRGAVRDLRPGHRDLPGGDAGGVDRLGKLHGGHHAGPVRAGHRALWRGATDTRISAGGCALARSRCSRWKTRRRTPATGFEPRSAAPSTRTAANPSCSAARAWWTWPRSLSEELGVPVVEGVTAAVKIVEGLATLGIGTSKRGGYAPPRPKAYSGAFARYAPDAQPSRDAAARDES